MTGTDSKVEKSRIRNRNHPNPKTYSKTYSGADSRPESLTALVPGGALQTSENVDELKGKAISLSLSLRRFSHFSSAKTIVESAFSFLLGLLTFQNVCVCVY